MSEAISPAEIAAYKAKTFPSYVFTAINDLLAKHYSNKWAQFKVSEVVVAIIDAARKADVEITEADVRDRGFLNFEEVYRKHGWAVRFDKADYTESRESYYEFRG